MFCFFDSKFQRMDRRILTFPAVFPCENISPATLLDSLITLSGNICNFRSKAFPTQRRNARETIRQVGILLMFFEEIRDRRLILPNSIVLSFSELHIAFQRIQFLLEDCSREGARVWILMNCRFVSTQFQVLIRSISTALDVLPLCLIDISNEVKELVELVIKQSRKVRLDLEKNDELAAKQSISILNQFESRIEPDLQSINRVLEYVEIRSWIDCNKEIEFLEQHIEFELSDRDGKEFPFLSSLVGFMSYSRGVVFDRHENRATHQAEIERNVDETINFTNLEDFRCPISLELMIDPVTISTGHTYDRSSIEKWFKNGNFTCPKTGEQLTKTELVPNSSLRNLIQQFCVSNGVSLIKTGTRDRDITRTALPGSPAAAEAMKFLSNFLARKLVFGSIEEKNRAAQEIRLLSKSNIFNRICLIESDTILPLLNLVNSGHKSAQENALSSLLKLSKEENGKKEIIENGGLRVILNVLKTGLSMESKQIAAATVFYLSSVNRYRKMIGETLDAIPTLIELIKHGTICGKRNAIAAIFGLLLYPKNHERVISSGTIPLLVEILASSALVDLKSDSLAVLATLSESVAGSFAILQTSPLHLLMGILQSSSCSRSGKEYCVSILLSLCTNGGGEVVVVLATDSLLMPSLYSLLTNGTTNSNKKVHSLIKIIHDFHEFGLFRIHCFDSSTRTIT